MFIKAQRKLYINVTISLIHFQKMITFRLHIHFTINMLPLRIITILRKLMRYYPTKELNLSLHSMYFKLTNFIFFLPKTLQD